MKLEVTTLRKVSPLLDEALDLEGAQREEWFVRLEKDNPALAPILRDLLKDQASAETNDFLELGPQFTTPNQGAHVADFKPDDAVGPYRLIRELGVGGMGEVWLAERSDGALKRSVALKLPMLSLRRSILVQRFQRERDILAPLNHPHIARLYDAGVSDKGQPFLSLEYVDGESLNAWCDKYRLNVKARINLFLQVLSAVQYAHGQLVVHRDLKPSNILVTSDGEVKLLDFGIAKLIRDGEAKETELTRVGGRALTPQYASPEQILGLPIGIASDVYSLGVVLYELLTGTLPYKFKRESRVSLEEAILNAAIPRPSQADIGLEHATARGCTARKLTTALKGDLDTIILKALKTNAAERYASAQMFAEDLRRHLSGKAVSAQPDSTWYRTRKFVFRNWLAVGAATSVFVALLVGFGVALWQAQVARNEARTAQSVQTFLSDIFQANSSNQTDPKKARETTARELLDVGASKIDTSLKDAPEARAEVLRTISNIYYELGLNEKAAQLSEQRLQLLRTLRGPDHLDVADELAQLSTTIQSSNRAKERGPFLLEALRILELHPGHEPIKRLYVLRQLAVLEYDSRNPVAIDHARQSLAIAESIGSPTELIATLIVLGRIETSRDDIINAENTFKRAQDLARANPDTDRRQLILLIAHLGDAQFSLGKIGLAEQSFREGLERAFKISGENHIDAVQMEYRLGQVLFESARTDQGLELMRSAHARVVRVKGMGDTSFLPVVQGAEGVLLTRLGDIDGGLALLDSGLDLMGPNSKGRKYANMLLGRAGVLFELGRTVDGQADLLHFDQVIREGAIANREEAEARSLLEVRALANEGRLADARGALAKVGRIVGDERQSFSDWSRFLDWGDLALALGDPQTAMAVAERVLKQISSDPEPKFLTLREARAAELAGRSSLAMGNPAAAQPKLRRAALLAESHLDLRRSPVLAEIYVANGEVDLALGKIDSSRHWMAKAEAIHGTHSQLGDQYKVPLHALKASLKKRL